MGRGFRGGATHCATNPSLDFWPIEEMQLYLCKHTLHYSLWQLVTMATGSRQAPKPGPSTGGQESRTHLFTRSGLGSMSLCLIMDIQWPGLHVLVSYNGHSVSPTCTTLGRHVGFLAEQTRTVLLWYAMHCKQKLCSCDTQCIAWYGKQ